MQKHSPAERQKQAPNRLCLEAQLCFPLYVCAKEVVRQYRKPLKPLGLTYTQYVVMMALWEYGGMTVGQLGKRVFLDSGTLTPLLKRLEKQGLVRRTRPEANERTLFISLTEAGEQLKAKARQIPEAVQNCVQLSEDEVRVLKSLLDKAVIEMQGEKTESTIRPAQ